MEIIQSEEFDAYWRRSGAAPDCDDVSAAVAEIISAVRSGGDRAVRDFAARFDRSSPETLEVPSGAAAAAYDTLKREDPDLIAALEYAGGNIRRFAEAQREQFSDFECEISPGIITGQRIIPVERAAVYVPAGRFPLVSSVLMGVIPALAAGAGEVVLASPPLDDGLPDRRILAAAHLAGARRIFAAGGAQAIAALALGTESIPRADLIVGPGNKYVAAAKRILFGEVGIDFIAGPTDVLIIADGIYPDGTGAAGGRDPADLIAADLIAQAEHDPDARARALVPDRGLADRIAAAAARQLDSLPTRDTARQSLDAGGLITVYPSMDEAVRIANITAPEHLELQVRNPEPWIPLLRNYGSLFIGAGAAEVLGDYSAGINHTLPTSGSARFTGGLSVRHFLKTVTTLRCTGGSGYAEALDAAEVIARAESLAGHAASAAIRKEP
ncbi:histidinol dehydrogenase [Breznakiella homolactica]|uniref:Histidinol dehydrogenase n=1 Tax=Breznakiella homolactica TaxID=2798577 RepID=A0A7T7XQH5_9SPIR|nr:histidinol dehydrogenase [Breznakiella homolactica]QQO10616.1 histidinol dehydrogenase [Breznakiella homolactica]